MTKPKVSQAGRIIVLGLLLLLAGFCITKFLINFDQLQRLAEEKGPSGALETPLSAELSTTETPASPEERPANASMDTTQVAAWLVPLNRYRAMVGLRPVTADIHLSRGDFLHSHYLAVNYAPQLPDLRLGAEAHTEDSDKPAFSAEGAAAARASDIDWSWDSDGRPEPAWAIRNWMQVPFHRLQIINPYLRQVGYGSDCRGNVCFAALNTGTDVDPPPATPSPRSTPLVFPPDGSVIEIGEFSGEWPDPLTSCPGYAPPAGLPVTLEMGHLVVPGFSEYSIRKINGALLEACAFDADSYVNPDTAAESVGRAILRDFGAIVIVPRRSLSAGSYIVTVTAGQRYYWSFSVAPRNHE
jgi:hypothetical protein